MTNLTKEEKILKLDTLINEGKSLFVMGSYEQPDYSYMGDGPKIQTYTDVDHDGYPGWRMKSLALLMNILGGGHSTYVKAFEENCKSSASETYLRHGLGILKAVKEGYQDGTILEEAPPVVENKETQFQIIQVNENKNSVAVEYNVSNFDILINNIEKSDRENKKELVEEIKKIKDELERGNPTWETVKKWTIFALGLGKDLGINLLANIIAKSAHIN